MPYSSAFWWIGAVGEWNHELTQKIRFDIG